MHSTKQNIATTPVDSDELFLLMQERLNFKYPRAKKMLLMFWCMARLKHVSKNSLAESDLYQRYCQDATSKQQVPQADFASELLKALALLSITPKQASLDGQQVLRGIAWAQDEQSEA